MTWVSQSVALTVKQQKMYQNIFRDQPHKLSKSVFEKALDGRQKLLKTTKVKKPHLLMVVDFSLASTRKRLWIMDLRDHKLLYNTLVAHGRHTGQNKAEHFSNILGSKQSNLGFLLTRGTYTGKHGHSLILDGLEEGINDRAKERYIVIHGADYVSEEFIQKYGRLGRSFGCPALPRDLHLEIIALIERGTLLFIYHPDPTYWDQSELFKVDQPQTLDPKLSTP